MSQGFPHLLQHEVARLVTKAGEIECGRDVIIALTATRAQQRLQVPATVREDRSVGTEVTRHHNTEWNMSRQVNRDRKCMGVSCLCLWARMTGLHSLGMLDPCQHFLSINSFKHPAVPAARSNGTLIITFIILKRIKTQVRRSSANSSDSYSGSPCTYIMFMVKVKHQGC